MDNKEIYKSFSETEEDIPIYMKSWWLDAVCGEENWDVSLYVKKGRVLGAFPYYKKKKSIFNIITLPKFTQFTGPYLKYPESTRKEKIYSFEKDALSNLILNIPNKDSIFLNLNNTISNWLPFYWNGFKQTTRYTYIIKDISDLESVFSAFRSNIKTDIRKSEKVVTVEELNCLETFYKINTLTFYRQSMAAPYSFNELSKLDNILSQNSSRKILAAKDSNGNIHAAIYIVWDKNTTYYILSGGDPKFRNSGATSLLVWEAIKFASSKGTSFDFEGSSTENIERVFRSFGGERTPILQVKKTNSKLLKLREFLLDL